MKRIYEGYTDRFGKKHEADPARCKASVWGTWDAHQCTSKPKRDGWCGIHHPDAEAKRKAKSDAASAARREVWRLSQLRQNFATDAKEAVKRIAAGHNDPRGLCEELLAKYAEITK